MSRLGILGGTFDPIHHGHLVAAQEACKQLHLDRVLFVPASTPPHKTDRAITPGHHRLRMVEAATVGRACFGISLVDLNRPGPCYTSDTLRLIRSERGPDLDLFFIEGADSLADIRSWYQPEQIIRLCKFAVVQRPGVSIDLPSLEAWLPGLTERIHWVDMPLLDISSRDLRQRVRQGRAISYLVPPGVEAYIGAHGLYLS